VLDQFGAAVGKVDEREGVLCDRRGRYLGWVPARCKRWRSYLRSRRGEAPFVMRPRADGRYEVFGNCYIHGLMDSEAMKRHRTVKQKFRVC
jgi:hypothetical protein